MRDPEFQDQIDLPLQMTEGAVQAPRPNPWRKLCRVMEVVVYVLLLLSVIKLFGPEVDRKEEIQAELDRLSQIRDAKHSEVLKLRQEHRLLKTDKEYLETVARDRLALQREGEYIFRIARDDGE